MTCEGERERYRARHGARARNLIFHILLHLYVHMFLDKEVFENPKKCVRLRLHICVCMHARTNAQHTQRAHRMFLHVHTVTSSCYEICIHLRLYAWALVPSKVLSRLLRQPGVGPSETRGGATTSVSYNHLSSKSWSNLPYTHTLEHAARTLAHAHAHIHCGTHARNNATRRQLSTNAYQSEAGCAG